MLKSPTWFQFQHSSAQLSSFSPPGNDGQAMAHAREAVVIPTAEAGDHGLGGLHKFGGLRLGGIAKAQLSWGIKSCPKGII